MKIRRERRHGLRAGSLGTSIWSAAMAIPSVAGAATVTVNATQTQTGAGCSFEEAVTSLNNQSVFDACVATGGGAINAISIPNNANPYVASNFSVDIHRSVTITGGSTSGTTLQFSGTPFAGGAGLQMTGGAAIVVTLRNLTMRATSGNQLAGVKNVNANVTLNGVHITGFGYAGISNGATMHVSASTLDNNGFFGSLPFGGGISNSGQLFIDTTTIANNFADTGGGIANGQGGQLQITGGTVRSNQATERGGAIYSAGSAIIQQALLDSNSADVGGGIYVDENAVVSTTDCVVSHNQATTGGGAYVADASPTFLRTVFNANGAGEGGGAYFDLFSPESDITDSTFSNNQATTGAGIFLNDGCFLGILRSAFTGNHATGDGGGLYSRGQLNFVEQTTFSDNAAANGGGLFQPSGGELHFQHVTVANNSATQSAGGAYLNPSNPRMDYSLFAGNAAPSSPDVFINVPHEIGFYNLIGNTAGGGAEVPFPDAAHGGNNILNVDPRLGALQNLGGPTQVRPLLANSPAIDAIPASGDFATFDQRGVIFPRPRDGTDGAGRNGFDIGAYEQNPLQWEVESLTVVAQPPANTYSTLNDVRASAGRVGNLPAGNAMNQVLTYRSPTLARGTYSNVVRAKKGPNAGIFQLAVASSQGGPFNPIGSQDTYAPTETFAELVIGNITVTSAGQKYFSFTVTGKNTQSTSFQLFPDFIMPK